MELNRLISLPDLHHLRLIGPMAVAAEFVFVAFAGIALVSTVLSLAHRRSNPSLAMDFARVISPRFSVWLTLGLLPLLTLTLLLAQLVYASRYDIFNALLILLPLAAFALACLWLYRNRLNRFFGAVGVLALLAFIFPFVTLLEFLRRPEQWPLWNPLLPDIYNTMIFPRLAIFFAGGLLATGAALLGVYFAWPERRAVSDPALRVWAVVLTHIGAIALPALVVWDFALPAWGVQTVATVKGTAPQLVLLWLAAIGSGMLLLRGHARRAGLWSVIALAALALEVNRQHKTCMDAIGDKVALLQMQAETKFAAFRQQQEARYVSNVPLDPKAGERLYGERCASCHSFNQKVVGPANKDVLPKYRGDATRLAAFILNPARVDTSFPAMPAPGLSRREATAVAEYLLSKFPAEGAKP